MDDNLGWLLFFMFVIAFAWWLGRPRSKPPSSNEVPAPPVPEGSDSFWANVHANQAQTERDANQQAAAAKQALEARHSEDLALKARLTKFVTDSKLDRALIDVWDTARYYPAWSRRADWEQNNWLQARNVTESTNGDVKSLFLMFDGVNFEIRTHEWVGFESSRYMDMQLFEADDEVFAIKVGVERDEITYYRTSDVLAVKRQGTWANQIVRLKAMLDAKKKLSLEASKYRNAEEIKSRFKE